MSNSFVDVGYLTKAWFAAAFLTNRRQFDPCRVNTDSANRTETLSISGSLKMQDRKMRDRIWAKV